MILTWSLGALSQHFAKSNLPNLTWTLPSADSFFDSLAHGAAQTLQTHPPPPSSLVQAPFLLASDLLTNVTEKMKSLHHHVCMHYFLNGMPSLNPVSSVQPFQREHTIVFKRGLELRRPEFETLFLCGQDMCDLEQTI